MVRPGFHCMRKWLSVHRAGAKSSSAILMHANFLGQGTGGARIGIDAEEKVLTLSVGFPYEMNYPPFKECVEDFVNYVVYWRDDVAKFERER